jgi:hypothetical protein
MRAARSKGGKTLQRPALANQVAHVRKLRTVEAVHREVEKLFAAAEQRLIAPDLVRAMNRVLQTAGRLVVEGALVTDIADLERLLAVRQQELARLEAEREFADRERPGEDPVARLHQLYPP